MLIEKELAQLTGEVRRKRLASAIKDHYVPELLGLLGCNLSESIYNQWFVRMLRTPSRAYSPIYHLLMIQFLGYTVDTFFQLSMDYSPFGKGPWPCLNQTCHHYKHLSIEKCVIRVSQAPTVERQPVGIFSCACVFTYVRRGADTAYEDRFRYDRVETFGPVWDAALKKLIIDSKFSMGAAARKLGVDDKVVKNHLIKLGLLSTIPSDNNLRTTISDAPQRRFPPSRRYERRAALLIIREMNPAISRTGIRDGFESVYQWLRKHDSDWLEANLPPRKVRTHYPSYVDWVGRDEQLAKQVRESASRLRALPGKPVKINRAEIARELGNARIFGKALKRLSLTVEALDEVCETREDFIVRKIWWVAQCLVEEDAPATRSEIYSRAGLAGMLESPQVKAALAAALQMILSHR